MSDAVQTAKRSNTSVFTKRRVYELLRSVTDEVRSLKSPKAIVEHLEATARRYVPSGRGRQPGTTVDLAALQALLNETATEVITNDGSYLCGMCSAKWNTRDGFSGTLMDTVKLKKLVERGKITLPEGVAFARRKLKNNA